MSNATHDPIHETNALDPIVVTRHFPTAAERAAFYRRARGGEFTALARGAYVATDVWASLDRHARYRALLHAVALLHGNTVFSHHSAAALWRLPWVGSWPLRAHALASSPGGGQSTSLVVRHSPQLSRELIDIDGLQLTPLARTVVDVASVANFGQAVTVVDAALRRAAHPRPGLPLASVTHDDLRDELQNISRMHGRTKARAVIEFANGLADRPGESMSRVSMMRAGLPSPELQVELTGASGKVWAVDFWWRDHNLIGEFDGKWKYTDPEFMNGRTAHQVVLDEKRREDDLRAAGRGFARWDWPIAMSPQRLRAHLANFGLR